MLHNKLPHIITCISILICSYTYAGSSANVGPRSYNSSIQTNLESGSYRDNVIKNFTPNSLFYPPTRSFNPMASLQNETFLFNSLNGSYYRNANGQLWSQNAYGDKLLLEP